MKKLTEIYRGHTLTVDPWMNMGYRTVDILIIRNSDGFIVEEMPTCDSSPLKTIIKNLRARVNAELAQ